MKLSKKEILNIPLEGQVFSTSLHYAAESLPQYMGIRRLSEVSAKGILRYDAYSKHLLVNVELKGEMILPCSITFVDVPLAFKTKGDLVFGFNPDESNDIAQITGDELDLSPEFLGLIWLEVPALVIAPDVKELPHGNNWEVLTEDDYRTRKSSEPDERLAKFRDYKPK